MSLKMQTDINLLQAHYAELEQRLEEVEAQVELVNQAVYTIVGVSNDLRWDQFKNKLRLVREDKMPTPRGKGEKGKQ